MLLPKIEARLISLQLMTTHLNTSRWCLSVGKSSNATVCIWDRTALKTSWLSLFLEYLAAYGTDGSNLNIMVEPTDLFLFI